MVWGDRFRPLFLLKYRRVAKIINNFTLGLDFERILNIHPHLIVLVWCGCIVVHHNFC